MSSLSNKPNEVGAGASAAENIPDYNAVLRYHRTDINGNSVKKIASAPTSAAKNDISYEHESGRAPKPETGVGICRLTRAASIVGGSRRSCSSETRGVQKPVKAAGEVAVLNHDQHQNGNSATAVELWTNRCGKSNSKLHTGSVLPCEISQLRSIPCMNKQLKFMTKSSCNNSDHGNVGAVLHGWLQGMRETSPPRALNPIASVSSSPFHVDAHIEAATADEDLELIHRAWMVKHPSALDKLEEIVEAASGKRVAVFLDYDGTLSPIVEDPDRAFMSHQMRAIVKEVANVFPTAIISGRCKEKLHEFVQLPELYYAGSHGMEIIGPARPHNSDKTRSSNTKGSEVVLFQPAKEFTCIMDKVFKVLEEKTKGVPGARVEHNKFCVSVHFRCVKERLWLVLAELVQQVLQSYPSLHLTQGRKVLEIRPLIAWNKGKALDFLLKALGLNDQNTVFPIYLGDDRSDEDAFKVLNRRKHGLGILVTGVAKETNAVCSLRDPSEVGELLKGLVKWKRRRLNKYL